MKKAALPVLLLIVLAPLTFLLSCNKDGDEPSTERVSEIAGTWTATRYGTLDKAM